MPDKDKIPSLKEALAGMVPETGEEKPKVVVPEEFPPPPGDWTSHPVTRMLGLVLFLILVILGIFLGPEIWEFIKAHPFGAVVTLIVVLVFFVVSLVAYWRYRAMGRRDDRYWKTD